METASAGSRALLERYPELHFLLSYTPYEPSLPSEEGAPLLQKLSLEGIDILYVFGIGQGLYYEALREWLKEKRERRIIFLEEDVAALAAFVDSDKAEDVLSDPQVIVHFLSLHLEELAAAYPSDRIEVIASEAYQKKKKKRFRELRLKLLRLSSVNHAILTEALYGHKLLGNLIRNIQRWPESFRAGGLKGKFRGIPAVICGAGPSLNASLPLLKTLEDRALIIAGGSAIAALSNQGVQPHLGLALDPNEEEFSRLKAASAYAIPLIFASRLQPDVFNVLNAEWGYLVTDTGGPFERHFERQTEIESDPVGPELGQEAMSVTTLALALAVEMGCSPILFNGIDLAYTGMQRYASGVVPSSSVALAEMQQQKKAAERLLKRKDIRGHFVHTLVKWVMESECIAAFAKAHPEVRFFNVSAGGIGFPGVPNISFAEAVATELTQSLDLRALVHAEIQRLRMPLFKEKIAHEMEEIKESLIRLSSIAQKIMDELERIKETGCTLPTGRLTILEIDFQEEKAFECLFPALGPALDKLLSRAFFSSPESTEEEKRRLLLESKRAKWKQWKEMIDAAIAVFQNSALYAQTK